MLTDLLVVPAVDGSPKHSQELTAAAMEKALTDLMFGKLSHHLTESKRINRHPPKGINSKRNIIDTYMYI